MGRRLAGGSRRLPRPAPAPRTILAGPVLLVLLLAGCVSPNVPHPLPRIQRDLSHRPLPGKVFVLPFEDHRPRGNKARMGLAFIPLVPYATSIMERPDVLRHGSFQPLTAVPRSLARELREARVFSSTEYVGGAWEVEPGGDLIFEGAIRSSRFERRLYTYGLSALAAPLWLLGFPFQEYTWVVDVHVRLIDAGTAEVLWEHEFEEIYEQYKGLYYGRYRNLFQSVAARGIRKTVLELDRFIGAGGLRGDNSPR